MTELLLFLTFLALLTMGIPIAFSIGAATALAMVVSIDATAAVTTIAQRMAGGINSFALLAIPLFVFSGTVMSSGSIAQRLIVFARSLLGTIPGGLALVNVLSCTLFGAVSGSAVAATTAVGGAMIPAMEKDKYDREFAAALTACSATTGLLIPPSNVLIVYAVASGGISIAALFVAGYLPGILVALCLMTVCTRYAKRHDISGVEVIDSHQIIKAFIDALPSLLLIIIVIGGIIGGLFTATEAGAIAAIYALALSMFVYRELTGSELFEILLRSSVTTATVMLLIGTSIAMSWLLASEGVPARVADAMLTITENPLLLLLMINIVLLMVGSFMDITPAVMIFTPIFLPVAIQLGISPLHFGIIIVMNLSIGLCTPPVGSLLFVSCMVAKTKLEKMIRPLAPMYLAMIVALLVVTYVPQLSEALPRAFGLYP